MPRIFWFLAILLLFAPLVEIADYYLTVGGVAALLIALSRFTYPNPAALGVALVVALYPLFVYFIHGLFESQYSVEMGQFIGSYGLWLVSGALLVTAFTTKHFDLRIPVHGLLITLTALGLFQFVLARVFGSTLGFELINPLVSFDIFDSYLAIANTDYARAMGTYYEPSIFARVIATLAVIQLVTTKRPLLPLFYLAANAATTLSLGLVAISFLVLIIYYGQLSRRLIPLAFFLAIGLMISYEFLAFRLERDILGEGSTYVRLFAPLDAMATALGQYPMGLPLGSNEIVVRLLLTGGGFAEDKITNGVYEVLLYTGVVGLLLIGFSVLILLRLIAAGRRELALAVMMVLVATVASSSFLSIESTLLLYIFIVTMRRHDLIERLRTVGAWPPPAVVAPIPARVTLPTRT